MSGNDTLLAYLVPKLTDGVEDAATEALAYILNKSAASKGALADLVGVDAADIGRVETQVTAEDGSLPDLVCFDSGNEKRIIIEAKFWAGLTDNQPNAYIGQLPESGRSALLFITPDVRINTLWTVVKDRAINGGIPLEPVDSPARVPTARLSGTERLLMLASWTRLLDSMLAVAEDADIRAEIMQLRGLAQRQDIEAFLPLHTEELGPAFARRMRGFVRLVNEAVDARGVAGGWISIEGRSAGSLRYGYGRNFNFSGMEEVWWFGINHDQWANGGDTPLWLSCWQSGRGFSLEKALDQTNFRIDGQWVPIYLKTGVEYDAVLDDVARQLQEIGEAVRNASKAASAET